jgi:hypothetical protein
MNREEFTALCSVLRDVAASATTMLDTLADPSPGSKPPVCAVCKCSWRGLFVTFAEAHLCEPCIEMAGRELEAERQRHQVRLAAEEAAAKASERSTAEQFAHLQDELRRETVRRKAAEALAHDAHMKAQDSALFAHFRDLLDKQSSAVTELHALQETTAHEAPQRKPRQRRTRTTP